MCVCCRCVFCSVCVSSLYLLVDLQKLLHSHLLVLRNPQGSVDAPEAPSSTVLVEEQVLMLYLHKRRAGGRHGILTHAHTDTHIHTAQEKSAGSTNRRCPEGEGKKKVVVNQPGRAKGEKWREAECFPPASRVRSVDVVGQQNRLSEGRSQKVLEREREVCSLWVRGKKKSRSPLCHC